jgi:hypothetical protein
MAPVLMALAVVVVLALFAALYWWTRRSERDMSYDGPGMPDKNADGLRVGIALTSSQVMRGGV